MAKNTVSNRALAIACGLLVAAGASFLALAQGPRVAAGPGAVSPASGTLREVHLATAAQAKADHESRTAVERVIRVRVACEAGEAVAGATVRALQADDGLDRSRVEVTSREGLVQLRGPWQDEVLLEVLARGYDVWRGSCDIVAGECRVELHGRGSIVVACTNPEGFPAQVSASLRRLGGDAGASTHAALRPLGEKLQADGLRPGAFYEVSIDGQGGDFVLDRTQVQAGWPEPARVEVVFRPRVGHEVRVDGILAADGPLLRVSLASPGREGPGARVRWDPARSLGVATPVPFGSSPPTELLVRGPLGVLLNRTRWEAREQGPLELELQRVDVALVTEERPGPGEWLRWESEGLSGAEPPPRDDSVRLLQSSRTPPSRVDLRWGRLEARALKLPREAPIELGGPGTGELRIADIGERAVSLSSRPRNEAQELEPVGDEVWARVEAGVYQVHVDGLSFGAPIRIAPDEVRHVSLAELGQRARLRVVLPVEDGEAAAGEVLLSVSQVGGGNRRLRQLSLDAAMGEVSFVDLPPGEVYVQTRSETLGFARARAVLRADEETTLELPDWAAPRDVTLLLEGSDGVALAGEEFQIALIGQGQSGTIYGVTDEYGEASVRLAGGSAAMVGTKYGFSVKELDATATYLSVQFGVVGPDRLTVRLQGWWLDKARTVGVLRSRHGVTEFVPGRSGAEAGTFEVPRGDRFVVVVMLRDRSKVFVTPIDGTDTLLLDVAPPAMRVRVAPPGEEIRPETVVVRLERVGGIDVRGTSFARALGLAHAFGDDLELAQGAPLELLVEAAPAHGGVLWRSNSVLLEPGINPDPIQLGVIQ